MIHVLYLNISRICGICLILIMIPYMPTLERLKAVGGSEICFSEGRKMVHSAAFWIKSVQSNL